MILLKWTTLLKSNLKVGAGVKVEVGVILHQMRQRLEIRKLRRIENRCFRNQRGPNQDQMNVKQFKNKPWKIIQSFQRWAQTP